MIQRLVVKRPLLAGHVTSVGDNATQTASAATLAVFLREIGQQLQQLIRRGACLLSAVQLEQP